MIVNLRFDDVSISSSSKAEFVQSCESVSVIENAVKTKFAGFVWYLGKVVLEDGNFDAFDKLNEIYERFEKDERNAIEFKNQFVFWSKVPSAKNGAKHNLALVDQNIEPLIKPYDSKIRLVVDHRPQDFDSKRSKKLTDDEDVKIINDPEKVSSCIVVFEHCVQNNSSLIDLLKEIRLVQGNESNDVDSLLSSFSLSTFIRDLKTAGKDAAEKATLYLLMGAAWDYVSNKSDNKYDPKDSVNNKPIEEMLKLMGKKYPFFADSTDLNDFLSVRMKALLEFYNVEIDKWFANIPNDEERFDALLNFDLKLYEDENGNKWKFCNILSSVTVDDDFMVKLMKREGFDYIVKQPSGETFLVCFWENANAEIDEKDVIDAKFFRIDIFPMKNNKPICREIKWETWDPATFGDEVNPPDAKKKKRSDDGKVLRVARFVMLKGIKRKLIPIDRLINEIRRVCRKGENEKNE